MTLDLKRYSDAIPKAELHVHLEGSIQPATLLTLAQRNGVSLPVQNIAEMHKWFTFGGFAHFNTVFSTISRCLKTAADYELIVYEFGASMARQHIRYAEVTFSPSTHGFALGIPFDHYFSGLTLGRLRAQADFGVEIRWIFDIVRDIADNDLHQKRADYTVAVAIEGSQDGVIALGLGGSEASNPAERYAPFFDKARHAGLHSAPHAGETVGPTSIWQALQALGAERIGHGVRAIEDPVLIDYLKERQIPLEICPTSNILIGVYPTLAAHPLPRLHALGVPLTINSDDPPLFNTTLNHEVGLLGEVFGFDVATINAIVLNGVQHSFLPLAQKQEMSMMFQAAMDRLQGDLSTNHVADASQDTPTEGC